MSPQIKIGTRVSVYDEDAGAARRGMVTMLHSEMDTAEVVMDDDGEGWVWMLSSLSREYPTPDHEAMLARIADAERHMADLKRAASVLAESLAGVETHLSFLRELVSEAIKGEGKP